MRTFFRRIHLYTGLGAGLVILITCLTGAMLVFEKDMQMRINKEYYFVKTAGTKLPLQQLIKAVKDSFPEAKTTRVKVYDDPLRTAEINVNFPPAKNPKAEQTKSDGKKDATPARQPGFTIFTDPYTGQIIKKYNYRETGFYQVFALHRWLLGGDNSIGKIIVGTATVIFLFILITGFILWWPKTKYILKRQLKIKSDAGRKRINHDLHLVFGFYSGIFLFLFAFTGAGIAFDWFNKGIYAVMNSSPDTPAPPKSLYSADAKRISFDDALAAAKTVYANGDFYNIAMPSDSSAAINVNVLSKNAAHESATDAVYIDQYSGKVSGKLNYKEKSRGAKIRATLKPVHTGSIWGMPSKIVALLVCLLGATFPVTGTIMWINRTRKKKRKLQEII